MIGAVQPGLQIGKDEMDDRQKDVGRPTIAPPCNAKVGVEADVATPVVARVIQSGQAAWGLIPVAIKSFMLRNIS
jgi:hypothetical protein